jgi:hypothetical protein
MRKFEYMKVRKATFGITSMNVLGQEGWELVTILTGTSDIKTGEEGFFSVYKREIVPEEESPLEDYTH